MEREITREQQIQFLDARIGALLLQVKDLIPHRNDNSSIKDRVDKLVAEIDKLKQDKLKLES